MTSRAWLEAFRRNASRPEGVAGDDLHAVGPELRAALVASLGRFWLGEGGEGRQRRLARSTIATAARARW